MVPLPDYLDTGSGGTTVVLLHGLGANKNYYSATIEHLAPRHRCLAWSMPGYAKSPPLEEMTFPMLAQAVVSMLDDAGVDSAVILGHSTGGMIGQALWKLAPERVQGLILVATSRRFGQDPVQAKAFIESRLAPIEAGLTPADTAERVLTTISSVTLEPDVLAHAVAGMSSVSSEAYSATVRCITTHDHASVLPTINVPTLLISGSEDATTPHRGMVPMHEAIPGSKLVKIDGSGHLIDLEKPAEFRSAIDNFLDANFG